MWLVAEWAQGGATDWITGRADAQLEGTYIRRRPLRVALAQEVRTAFRFVLFVDALGRVLQTRQRPEEASIALVPPAHIAVAAPTTLAESVQTAVVADPKGRIGLDVVPSELAQASPAVEEARPAGNNLRYSRPSLGFWPSQCSLKRGQCLGIFG
ncbi:MAG: hypothetical protein QOJ19_1022 [Acidimicrobiia bacterium]|nr:hypothetical protein [Acidimicrobiia bacterium]